MTRMTSAPGGAAGRWKRLVTAGPLLVLTALLAAPCASAPSSASLAGAAGSGEPAGGHQGALRAVVSGDEGRLISAGDDGFLGIWNTATGMAEDRFQISPYPLVALARRPGFTEVAVLESDGKGHSRVSAWDYAARKRLFTLTFTDPAAGVTYAASGGFLIISRESGGVLLADSATGAFRQAPGGLTGVVSFAATGLSGRSMITYLPAGRVSYWNLETGAEISAFSAPALLRSPALLGNNRFLAGFDAQGLVVLDAVSGGVILRETAIRSGFFLIGDPALSEFVCVSPGSSATTLYHLEITSKGKLEVKNRKTFAPAASGSSAAEVLAGAVVSGEAVALGMPGGGLILFRADGSARAFTTRSPQRQVTAAAAAGGTLGFLTGERLGAAPLDYTRLTAGATLRLSGAQGYTALAADSSLTEAAAGSPEFLLWQEDSLRPPLEKIFSTIITTTAAVYPPGVPEERAVDALSLRYPLRSAAVLAGKKLFLDSLGNLTVLEGRDVLFTFRSTGAQDAVFIDEDNVLIGRSAGTGTSAFLMVNIRTGETVPLPFTASVGARVFRDQTGSLYGLALRAEGASFTTQVVRFDRANPAQSRVLAEYPGEDTRCSLAAAGGLTALVLGDDEAAVYRSPGGETGTLERTGGFPARLVDQSAGAWFVLVDTEGTITWHDPASGRVLAALRLYETTWTLSREGTLVSGPLAVE